MGDVASAARFPGIRTFNDTVLAVFALPPTELLGARLNVLSVAKDGRLQENERSSIV